ncbi:TrkA C-terminal domain-containing protein [Dactylosporangium sp. NPDC051484]|uniref:TrkA C-terminal domain-containing protein n=1 Tax=Dactylosporangium sp. NPDC051484 TaxID=3154942 RepID=UPI00344B5C3A
MQSVRTPLPGVGSLHVLHLHDGQRIGVIRHHDHRREVVVYDPADAGTRLTSTLLTAVEAQVLAGLVESDGPQVHSARLERVSADLTVVQVMISAESSWLRRPVGDIAVDGAVIAAVIRDERVLPADPRPQCEPGDVLVIVGRPDAALKVLDVLLAG